MKKKFPDAVDIELKITNIHYKKLQYVFNFADPCFDRRIVRLREIFPDRESRHNVGLSVKSGYKVLSKDVHDEILLLCNKTFTISEIRVSLQKLLKFSEEQIDDLCKFVGIMLGKPKSVEASTSPIKSASPIQIESKSPILIKSASHVQIKYTSPIQVVSTQDFQTVISKKKRRRKRSKNSTGNCGASVEFFKGG